MQRTVDDIKERAKYLRDMLAEYADDETVWLDNEDDMEYFADAPAPTVVEESATPNHDDKTKVTPEMAHKPTTHPLVTGYQEEEAETTSDTEPENNENEGDHVKSEDIDEHLANILADVPSRNVDGDTPAKTKKSAENKPSVR